MHIIAKCIGGSHAYNLHTPESDVDVRGVFLNTDFSQIISTNPHNKKTHYEEEETDTKYQELRRFIELLRKGNTGALETLFSDNWISVDPLFEEYFCRQRMRFVDSHKIYWCLKGYLQSELRLAMGERLGVIGHKRHEQVKKYGFSPKNFTQLFRLQYVGIHLFNTSEFIVDCKKFSSAQYNILMSVKTHPEKYKAIELKDMYRHFDVQLDKAFEKRQQNYFFDENYAIEAMLRFYYPIIKAKYDTLK